MNIKIICLGKLKEKYLVEGVEEYLKRISKYANINIVELQDETIPDNPSQKEIEYLAELNLIKTSENHMECDIYSIEEMRLFFKVDDKQFEAVSPYDEDENRFYVCVGQVFFTQTGLALYNAIVKNIETYEYLYDVLKVYIEHRKENGGYDND